MGRREELRDDAVDAFYESTNEMPSDVEMGIISMGAREIAEQEEANGSDGR